MNLQFSIFLDLLRYLKLELTISTKNLIGYQGDVIRCILSHCASKIKLNKKMDVLECDFKVTRGYRGLN